MQIRNQKLIDGRFSNVESTKELLLNNYLADNRPRSNRIAPRGCDWFAYKERHLIECFFGKIKHHRRVFSRFEKHALNCMGFVRFVSTLIWLR